MQRTATLPRSIAPTVGSDSPWGRIDHAREIAPGIVSVSTPSHGGIWISPEREAIVPAAARSPFLQQAGWYEEDVDAAIPAYVFADLFRPSDPAGCKAQAAQTLRFFPKYATARAALGISA